MLNICTNMGISNGQNEIKKKLRFGLHFLKKKKKNSQLTKECLTPYAEWYMIEILSLIFAMLGTIGNDVRLCSFSNLLDSSFYVLRGEATLHSGVYEHAHE